jgi:hypothetical protein
MRHLAACILMLVLPLVAGSHERAHPREEKIATPLWAGPAFSGSWFSADRAGEGFILQVLDNGTALLLWFTFPPSGSSAQQAWIYADGGAVEGDRIRFTNAVTTHGGRFGATSGPVIVQRIPWGSVEFQFTGCNAGTVTYAGPPTWGSGTRSIVRLTEHAELGCGGKQRLTSGGTRAMAGLRQRSGGWYNPASDADGWALEELGDGRAIIYWFTHDAAGEQAWTYGESPTSGDHFTVTNYRPTGTHFGTGFDASRVTINPWGTLEVTFNGCDRGTLAYASLDAAFGAGTLSPARLSTLAGAACVAQQPAVPTGGTWSAGATMPLLQSEAASATIGSRACTAGNFPAGRDFQCYDAIANAWTALAPLPAGRDHGEMVAYEGSLYFTGGAGEDGDAWGWRYDFGPNRWTALPELPLVSASGAALLNGYAYYGGLNALYQYNPRTRQLRTIAGDSRAPRDHSQVVAFQGEIWLMAGRSSTGAPNGVVSIFDPASETWRRGPLMLGARSGFAANASSSYIFVAGGEKLDAPTAVISTAEAIAAGDSGWTALPPLPFGVHGVGSTIQGNAFYTLGGSRLQATAINFGDVQIYRW